MKLIAKVLLCICCVFSTAELFADYGLIVTAPTVSDAGIQSALNAAAASIQTSLNNDHFSKLGDLSDMSRGFANATSAVSYAGTNQSFQNYSLFSIMGGVLLGVSVPSGNLSVKSMENRIDTSGDAYLGVIPSFALSVGMPITFMNEKIFVSGKIGGADISTMSNGTTYQSNSFLMGIGANYILLDDPKYLLGIFRWRGISLGVGINYIESDIKLNVPLSGSYPQTWTSSPYTGTLTVDNVQAALSIKTSSLTIPVEALTSVQFLWFANAGCGAGMDINIPSARITSGGNASVRTNLPAGVTQSSPGSISFEQTTNSKQKLTDVLSPKIMVSLGINISLIKFDFPMIYYPASNTFAVGITAGAVW